VFVNVLNRNPKRDITARIDNAGAKSPGEVAVWEMNPTDLKAVNTFDDRKVRPATRTVAVAASGSGFDYKFPAHSLTILTLKMD
jgi:alpha-L-arabinofuranosidase